MLWGDGDEAKINYSLATAGGAMGHVISCYTI